MTESNTAEAPIKSQIYVGGTWGDAIDRRTYQSIDPYTQQPWAEVPDAGEGDVAAAVAAAQAALVGPWGALTGFERSELMRRLADLIERDAEELALAESRDNGKPLKETRGQMANLPSWLRYFSGLADKIEGKTIPSDRSNYFVYTKREPIGVVAAIVPWNSPLLLLMWKLAPALAAGCTLVVKPSDSTPVSTLELARRVEEAGFPAGVFNVLTGQSADLGKALVAHPDIDLVAFTGSPEVGAQVASQAASHLVPSMLELGGKSAQIVFDDCDLETAAAGVVGGIFAGSGQTCIAGSRLLVQESIADRFVEVLVERAGRIRLGDPRDPATDVGPMANQRQYETVVGFIERAGADGGEVATGGPGSDQGGLFIDPTVVRGLSADSELAQKEVFGPVLTVLTFIDEEDAVRIANGTIYALGAGIWSTSLARTHRVAAKLKAGTVWVNTYRILAPNVPFGGSGASGWGRENGSEALDEFLHTKAVWIEISEAARDPFSIG